VNLEQTEREKYERIWSHQDYRSNSPGERLVPYFLQHVRTRLGETLIDLGCGTGRAGAALSRHGLNVWLYDHVNASEVKLPFMLGNLWATPMSFGFDWFYCVDVLEHMPTEKVDDVLDNCAAIAKGGFFQIALFPSDWFGEVLHLTVMPQDWWIEKIKARWKSVKTDAPEKGRIVAIVRHDAG
jgi:2-polyprenyl-3-methyl-5-hydroxy-6-metoxy-1,4-benzoquinol methylase